MCVCVCLLGWGFLGEGMCKCLCIYNCVCVLSVCVSVCKAGHLGFAFLRLKSKDYFRPKLYFNKIYFLAKSFKIIYPQSKSLDEKWWQWHFSLCKKVKEQQVPNSARPVWSVCETSRCVLTIPPSAFLSPPSLLSKMNRPLERSLCVFADQCLHRCLPQSGKKREPAILTFYDCVL